MGYWLHDFFHVGKNVSCSSCDCVITSFETFFVMKSWTDSNTPGLRLQPKVLTPTLVPTPASHKKVGQLNVDRPRTNLSLKAPYAELARPSPVIDRV